MTIAQRTSLSSFLRGDMPLGKIFWLHGVVAGLVAGVVLEGLRGLSPGLQQIWAGLILVYLLAWYVGLWRSSGRYQGSAVWKWAARCVVVMPVVGILLTVALSRSWEPSTQRVTPQTVPNVHLVFDKEGKRCTQVTEFLGECKRQP